MWPKEKWKQKKGPLISFFLLGIIFTVYFNGLSVPTGPGVGYTDYNHRVDDKGTLTISSPSGLINKIRTGGLDSLVDSKLQAYTGIKTMPNQVVINLNGLGSKVCPKKKTSILVTYENITYSVASASHNDLHFAFGERESITLDGKSETLNTLKLDVRNNEAWISGSLRVVIVGCNLDVVNRVIPLKITGAELRTKAYFNSELASFSVKKMMITNLTFNKLDYNLISFPKLFLVDHLLKAIGVYSSEDIVARANQEIVKQLKAKPDVLDPYNETVNEAILPNMADYLAQEQSYNTSLGSEINMGITLDQIETHGGGLVVKFSSVIDIEGKQDSCAQKLDWGTEALTSYPAKKYGLPSIGIGFGLLESLVMIVGKEGKFCIKKSGLEIVPNGPLVLSSSAYPYVAKSQLYSEPKKGSVGVNSLPISQTVSTGSITSPSIKLPVLLSMPISPGISFHGQANLTINFALETLGKDSTLKFVIKYMKLTNITSSTPKPAGLDMYVDNLLNFYQEQRITKTYSKVCEKNKSEAWDQSVRYERVIETFISNCPDCEKNVNIDHKALVGLMESFIKETVTAPSSYTLSFGKNSAYPRVEKVLVACPPQQMLPGEQDDLDDTIEEIDEKIQDGTLIKDRI